MLAIDNALNNLTNADLIRKLSNKEQRSAATTNSNNFYGLLEEVFGQDAIKSPSSGGGGSLVQRGGAFYNTVNSNPLATQQLEFGTSPLSYYVTVYLELEKGKVLTASNLVKAKCNTGYNKLLYDFSRFIGKDFVLPPDYNKLPDSVLNNKKLIEDSKRNSRNQYYNPNSNPNRNPNSNIPRKYSRRRRGGKKSNKKSRKNNNNKI
jgi:hypothetical protein